MSLFLIQILKSKDNVIRRYADKLKRGTIVYKDYKPLSLAEQEKALAEENEDKAEAKAPSVYPMYFYHPDHLGTSTALTDFNGNAYQFFLNLPFGETMAQQLGSNYYNSPYKFNGKELDEETGLYYYGARYFDPRISIFQSTDQMAEKYPNVNPYAYCFQNPINYIDPTGMEGEDSNTGPPKKNIYIVLDYSPTSGDNSVTGDNRRDSISFKGMEENGWHGIYAQNIQDAEKQLTDYLKGGSAQNIVLESHGGFMVINGVKSNETSFMSDNNSSEYIRTKDLANSVSGSNSRNPDQVQALTNIISHINEGGGFYLNTCDTGSDNNFFFNLQTLTGNKVNLYGNSDWQTRYWMSGAKTGEAIYNSENLLNKDFIIPKNYKNGAKLFQPGCNNDGPITLKNMRINKKGIIPQY